MGNNKTIVPGMNNYDFNNSSSQTTQMYSAPQQPYMGTQFPNMDVNVASQGPTHKMLMGFLYSVSRTSEGEYWPLYLGLNTIGRATNSSVRLAEATISDNHAEIVIRQMKNPDSVLVSIQDARSTCGTLLNGSSLGFDAQECHNGDIITVGEHYELYLIIVDAKSLGLAKRDDFVMAPGVSQPMPGAVTTPGMMGGGMPYGAGMPYPNNSAGQPRSPQPNRNNSSTVIMPAVKK